MHICVYACICMFAYKYVLIYVDRHAWTSVNVCMYVCMCHWNEYECRGNEYTPFSMEFLCFGGKIPSLLDFDDAITLHH